VFAGCNSEPVTEPDTTQQQTTEQPTTEQVKNDILIDTGLRIGGEPVYTREFDENKLTSWDSLYNLEPIISQESNVYYDIWKEYEGMLFYGGGKTDEDIYLEGFYKSGMVAKINVTDVKTYAYIYTDSLTSMQVINICEAIIEENFKTYNGCELKKGDKITLREDIDYSITGESRIKLIESYGGKVREEKQTDSYVTNYYIEGLKYGYYELRPETDTKYSYIWNDFEPSLTILEKGEYLALIIYDKYYGMFSAGLVSPWSSCDYTKFDMYKNVTLGKHGSKLLPDFYNTFVK